MSKDFIVSRLKEFHIFYYSIFSVFAAGVIVDFVDYIIDHINKDYYSENDFLHFMKDVKTHFPHGPISNKDLEEILQVIYDKN